MREFHLPIFFPPAVSLFHDYDFSTFREFDDSVPDNIFQNTEPDTLFSDEPQPNTLLEPTTDISKIIDITVVKKEPVQEFESVIVSENGPEPPIELVPDPLQVYSKPSELLRIVNVTSLNENTDYVTQRIVRAAGNAPLPKIVSVQSLSEQRNLVVVKKSQVAQRNRKCTCSTRKVDKVSSTKPIRCSEKYTQTESCFFEDLQVVPLPVPIFVAIPMGLFTSNVPIIYATPVPVPVPMFLDMKSDSVADITEKLATMTIPAPILKTILETGREVSKPIAVSKAPESACVVEDFSPDLEKLLNETVITNKHDEAVDSEETKSRRSRRINRK